MHHLFIITNQAYKFSCLFFLLISNLSVLSAELHTEVVLQACKAADDLAAPQEGSEIYANLLEQMMTPRPTIPILDAAQAKEMLLKVSLLRTLGTILPKFLTDTTLSVYSSPYSCVHHFFSRVPASFVLRVGTVKLQLSWNKMVWVTSLLPLQVLEPRDFLK